MRLSFGDSCLIERHDCRRLCVALRDGDIHFYEVSAATLESYNPMVLMHIHHLGGDFIDASFSADSQLLGALSFC